VPVEADEVFSLEAVGDETEANWSAASNRVHLGPGVLVPPAER
jgi:hypothetical protein